MLSLSPNWNHSCVVSISCSLPQRLEPVPSWRTLYLCANVCVCVCLPGRLPEPLSILKTCLLSWGSICLHACVKVSPTQRQRRAQCVHNACKGNSKDKLKQSDVEEEMASLSISPSIAYHNNKDSVTFPDEEQTKTTPAAYRSAWSLVVFHAFGDDHHRRSYRGPPCNVTVAVLL